MNSKEVYLKKNSRIHYNGKILTGDDMYFNQITGFGKAIGNVKLDDPAENRYILGGYGEIYENGFCSNYGEAIRYKSTENRLCIYCC